MVADAHPMLTPPKTKRKVRPGVALVATPSRGSQPARSTRRAAAVGLKSCEYAVLALEHPEAASANSGRGFTTTQGPAHLRNSGESLQQ
jgi:hypothetical protein